MSNIASTKNLLTQLTLAFVIVMLATPSAADEIARKATTISDSRATELSHMVKHDCGSCHGMTLKGGLGPSLLPEQFKDKNIEYIKLTILHGRSGTAMPPWKSIISDDDAEWIAEFLLSGKINQLNQ